MKELKYKCICGAAFEELEELQSHQMVCVFFRKSIIKQMPKHKEKQQIKVGVKNVSNKIIKDEKPPEEEGHIKRVPYKTARRSTKSSSGASLDKSNNQKIEAPENEKSS